MLVSWATVTPTMGSSISVAWGVGMSQRFGALICVTEHPVLGFTMGLLCAGEASL